MDRLLPGLWQLRHYERGWLRGDVIAGVTVAAYLVPQVMAYAEVAGLPAITGLWAVVAPLAVYAILGSSKSALGRAGVHHFVDDGRGSRRTGGRKHRPHAEAAAALAIGVGAVCIARVARPAGFPGQLCPARC